MILNVLLIPLVPAIAPYEPQTADPSKILRAPTAEHLLGTDSVGMDILSRVLFAPRIDLTVPLAAVAASALLGLVLGGIAGYFRGSSIDLLMRTVDTIQSFPIFILAMALAAFTGRSLIALTCVLAAVQLPIFLRLVRGEVLSVRERTYIEAARGIGLDEWHILLRHALPNAVVPVIVQASVAIGWSILLISGLSFVGAGVRVPTPEWGSMVAVGAPSIALGHWWPAFYPGLAIAVTVIGFALVGETFEDYLRPGSPEGG
ncbi:MAG: ABC transporter permease [Armatimonadota bacterium]